MLLPAWVAEHYRLLEEAWLSAFEDPDTLAYWLHATEQVGERLLGGPVRLNNPASEIAVRRKRFEFAVAGLPPNDEATALMVLTSWVAIHHPALDHAYGPRLARELLDFCTLWATGDRPKELLRRLHRFLPDNPAITGTDDSVHFPPQARPEHFRQIADYRQMVADGSWFRSTTNGPIAASLQNIEEAAPIGVRRGRKPGFRQIPKSTFPARYRAAYRSVYERNRSNEELPTAPEVAGELGISLSTFWNYIGEANEVFPPQDFLEGAN